MAFDRDYFQRFYVNPRTAVASRVDARQRAALIVATINYLGMPVRSILDAGCGLGWLRAPLQRAWPRARYTGVDASEYLCERFGWQHAKLEQLPTQQRYDLVICYDVLQYLEVTAARAALGRVARVCRGALYFSALTTEDWRENCDRTRTDPIRALRNGEWYRRQLRPQFRFIGCGIWLRRSLALATWNLEEAVR